MCFFASFKVPICFRTERDHDGLGAVCRQVIQGAAPVVALARGVDLDIYRARDIFWILWKRDEAWKCVQDLIRAAVPRGLHRILAESALKNVFVAVGVSKLRKTEVGLLNWPFEVHLSLYLLGVCKNANFSRFR